MAQTAVVRSGEYEARGEYHRKLDRKWKYYPVYVCKMAFVRKYLHAKGSQRQIIDVGCGEGILVEEYREKGFDIVGLDMNYKSAYVNRGDLTKLPFADESFDLLTALDVIEHLDFEQQERAFAEIHRILRPGGRALLSIPNLAHIASRVSFLLAGRLLRTSTIDRHKGDRPIQEYLALCKKHYLKVVSCKGLFPTLPVLAALTCAWPDKVAWLHRIYNVLPLPASYCFLNMVEVRKSETDVLSFKHERPRIAG
jgi:2-polyprenyl-3-methyl-5-hydroxy-6-metoxy-1,4-benzoquinol methylase